MSRPALRGVIVVRAVIASVLVCMACACTPQEPARQFNYVIPEGMAGLIATNRAPEIFPPNLVVHVGDSITIVNDDRVDQEVGPYLVKAKTKISQHFSSPGVLEGSCKMSLGGKLTVTILPKA